MKILSDYHKHNSEIQQNHFPNQEPGQQNLLAQFS